MPLYRPYRIRASKDSADAASRSHVAKIAASVYQGQPSKAFWCDEWGEFTNSTACAQRKSIAHLVERCRVCAGCTRV